MAVIHERFANELPDDVRDAALGVLVDRLSSGKSCTSNLQLIRMIFGLDHMGFCAARGARVTF
jgi:hypothetical protein